MIIMFHQCFKRAEIAPDGGGISNSKTVVITVENTSGLHPYRWYNVYDIDFLARNIVFV